MKESVTRCVSPLYVSHLRNGMVVMLACACITKIGATFALTFAGRQYCCHSMKLAYIKNGVQSLWRYVRR